MKPIAIFCLVLSLIGTLHAQQAAPQPSLPPLPPGPLIKRTPDYSTWTVTYKGQPIEEKAPVKPATTGESEPKDKEAKEPVTMLSSVVKTGSTILEQSVDAAGQRRQVWHVSGIRIVAGSSNPMVCPDYGSDDIFSVNFASSDFAGLYWVSPATYVGIVKYQGNDCMVFKGSVSPLSERSQIDERENIERAKAFGQSVPEEVKVPAAAYIDLETRLPLFVQFGNEKRFYRYGDPPQAPLALPPELKNSLKAYSQHIQNLSAPASRPY